MMDFNDDEFTCDECGTSYRASDLDTALKYDNQLFCCEECLANYLLRWAKNDTEEIYFQTADDKRGEYIDLQYERSCC